MRRQHASGWFFCLVLTLLFWVLLTRSCLTEYSKILISPYLEMALHSRYLHFIYCYILSWASLVVTTRPVDAMFLWSILFPTKNTRALLLASLTYLYHWVNYYLPFRWHFWRCRGRWLKKISRRLVHLCSMIWLDLCMLRFQWYPWVIRNLPYWKVIDATIDFDLAVWAVKDSRLAFHGRVRSHETIWGKKYVVMAQLLPTRWSPTVTILIGWFDVGSISIYNYEPDYWATNIIHKHRSSIHNFVKSLSIKNTI